MADPSASTPDRAGIVLAGGYSRRFGEREKALASIDGEPMLGRVLERLDGVVDSLFVSCRAAQKPGFERVLRSRSPGFVADPVPGEGPLFGLHAALREVDAAYVAVVACDMPAVDPDFVAHLFERAAGLDGAVPRLRDGTPQPAQAVYRTEAMREAASRELEAGGRSLRGAVDCLDVLELPPSEVERQTRWCSLANVNTETELAALEGGDDPGVALKQ